MQTLINSNPIKSDSKFSKVIFLLIISLLLLITVFYIGRKSVNNSAQTINITEEKTTLAKPKFTKNLNKQFIFSIKDDKGKELTKFTYVVESAELLDEILVKGQKATAVKDRTFLIINIKIKNDSNENLQIFSRDYIRLIINEKDEKLSPDIHNDPLEIQPISTKYSRLGFAINETDKNLKLQVGEITGNKATIDLKLK